MVNYFYLYGRDAHASIAAGIARETSSAVRGPFLFGSVGDDGASEGIDGVSDRNVAFFEAEIYVCVVGDHFFDAFGCGEDGAVILFGECSCDFGI